MHNDNIFGIKSVEKDFIMSGSKSMQTLILSKTKPVPKYLIAWPKYMHKSTFNLDEIYVDRQRLQDKICAKLN